MLSRAIIFTSIFAVTSIAVAFQQNTPREMTARVYEVGQSIADELMNGLGADAAFVPVGILNDAPGKSLDRALQFPTDDAAVVLLSGKQIRDALERSIALYPSPNPVFLQLAGIDVEFDANRGDARIVSVSVGGSALDNAKKYRIAMPGSLARGGLGYSTIWDRAAIEKPSEPRTMESLLKGKQSSAQSLHWKSRAGDL